MCNHLPATILLASLFLASLSPAQNSRQVVAKAHIWPYASLCKFPDSENWPSSMTYKAGVTTTITGCTDLEKKLGQPSAVRITIVNLGETKLEIQLEGLNSVMLSKKNGKKVPALAWRHRQRSPVGSGYTTAFMNGFTGIVIASIDPASACDFMFLFPSAEPGDLVTVPGIKSVRISG